VGAVARYPILSFPGLYRGTPSRYFRQGGLGGSGPALLTNAFTAACWFRLERAGAAAQDHYLVGSRAADDGWAFSFTGTIATGLQGGGTFTASPIGTLTPGLHVALLSWNGATLRARLLALTAASTAAGGTPSSSPNRLVVGSSAAAPTTATLAARESAVGGFIVQSAFRIDPADEVTYLEAVAGALRQDRDIPLPDGGAGTLFQDWYWDGRDWPGSGDWIDRVSGQVLPPVGVVERTAVAGAL
jgi:hypothetical protein